MRARLFLGLVFVAGFAVAPAQLVGGRTDTQKEIELGRESYDQMLRQGLLSRNEAAINRVNRIFASLINVMPERLYPYQVVLVGTNEVNASCLPGGYICVYEGLESQLKSDDALAFVLAHEIGHGALRHWSRRARKQQSDVAFGVLLAGITGVGNNHAVLKSLAHTRAHEREADGFGVELYLKAGYDPNRVTSVVDLFDHLSPDSGRVPYYLLSHPPNAERREAIEKKRAELMASGKAVAAPVTNVEVVKEAVFGKMPEVALAENAWFPLKTGATWEYGVKGASDSSYRVSVIGAGEHGAGKVSRLRLEMGATRVEYQCFTSADAVYRRNRPQSASSAWEVEFAFPGGDAGVENGKWTFRSLGEEEVETPFAKYPKARKVEAKQGERVLHLWFVESVGLVRRLNVGSGTDEVLLRFTAGR